MISRIRLDAYGKSPEDVANTLYPHADLIEGPAVLGVPVSRGECVIERQLGEPEGSAFAFRGRLVLHPDISTTAGAAREGDEAPPT